MKRALTAILAVAVFLVAGCIDFEQDLTLNADGSGTIAFQMKFDKSYLSKMDEMNKASGESGGMTESPDEDIPTEEEIKTTLKKHPGVKLLAYNYQDTETEEVWTIKFGFESVAAFHAMNQALEMESTENERPSEPAWSYTEQDDGTWLFVQGTSPDEESTSAFEESEPYVAEDDYDDDATEDEYASEAEDEYEIPDSTELAEQMDDSAEAHAESVDDEDYDSAEEYADTTGAEGFDDFVAAMEEMMAAMEKMKVKISVSLPGTIIESNATRTEGNTAIWEYSGSEAMQSESTLYARVKQ